MGPRRLHSAMTIGVLSEGPAGGQGSAEMGSPRPADVGEMIYYCSVLGGIWRPSQTPTSVAEERGRPGPRSRGAPHLAGGDGGREPPGTARLERGRLGQSARELSRTSGHRDGPLRDAPTFQNEKACQDALPGTLVTTAGSWQVPACCSGGSPEASVSLPVLGFTFIWSEGQRGAAFLWAQRGHPSDQGG